MTRYHLYHAAGGTSLERLDRSDESAAAYDQALPLTADGAERRLLQRFGDAIPR